MVKILAEMDIRNDPSADELAAFDKYVSKADFSIPLAKYPPRGLKMTTVVIIAEALQDLSPEEIVRFFYEHQHEPAKWTDRVFKFVNSTVSKDVA